MRYQIAAFKDKVLALGREASFKEGMKDYGWLVTAVLIWSGVTGFSLVKVGLTPLQVLGMTLIVYAGTAQLAVAGLILAGIPLWTILLTASIVNLRFSVYSLYLHPYFRHWSIFQRAFIGQYTGDISIDLFKRKYPKPIETQRSEKVYFLGLCFVNWAGWQVGTLIGVLLALWVPDALRLGFAGGLALVAFILPKIDSWVAFFITLMTIVISVMADQLPYKSHIVLCVVMTICVTYLSDREALS